ncbi:MAG: Lpg1974 family pore-forming outer membrane protein, partial [Planctomycetota bacterium]|nr:Lpg1974 family pore-forming outer membrane protein [Planctomycetota bacterium]
SLLLGRVSADFSQTNSFSADNQAHTSMDDDRLVPNTELEIGLDWNSSNGHWQFSGGYYITTYHNTLTTGRFIQSVQAQNLYNMEENLIIAGLMARIELRW